MTALEGAAEIRSAGNWDGVLYRQVSAGDPKQVPVRLIPYFAWGNRGDSEMTVWIPLSTR